MYRTYIYMYPDNKKAKCVEKEIDKLAEANGNKFSCYTWICEHNLNLGTKWLE